MYDMSHFMLRYCYSENIDVYASDTLRMICSPDDKNTGCSYSNINYSGIITPYQE